MGGSFIIWGALMHVPPFETYAHKNRRYLVGPRLALTVVRSYLHHRENQFFAEPNRQCPRIESLCSAGVRLGQCP